MPALGRTEEGLVLEQPYKHHFRWPPASQSHSSPRRKGRPVTIATWCGQHVLEEVIIFSRLTMTKINSSWKGCNERLPQLASTLFFIYSALIPVTFGHQPNVVYVRSAPWMWNPLFLNDGWWLGCRAEERGQLTWPRGDSLRVCGSPRNKTLTPEGERPWGHSADWSRPWRCTWWMVGSHSKASRSSP